MASICILGRQPAIGIAELESLYGANAIRLVGKETALVEVPSEEIDFKRLGGSIKLGKVLASLPTTKWQDIQEYLATTIPKHLQYLPEGKLQLGLSVYGITITPKQLQASGLTLKKIIRGQGRSVRLIPNQEPALNSAQVLHNHLTGKLGWELVLIKDGQETLLAQTIAVQDINAYAARDQARPKRDARVGMLPPKLAQIIINLAVDRVPVKNILDPFCGTGVLIQEALLMGYEGYGADIENRMGEFYRENMDWLLGKYPNISRAAWQMADAATATWETSKIDFANQSAERIPLKFDTIASETYLGRPFSVIPTPDVLQHVVQDVDTIHKKFLQNVRRQTRAGFRMCLAVPAWKTPHGFKHLPVLDHLEELGYTRVSFVHARNDDLIYHRPNQVVGRELVILTRK